MDKSGPFGGIYSGQIIGAVVKALDLEQSVLKDRTAQRFFAGQSVSEHSRTEIFLALGAALVERGIVPEPPLLLQYNASIAVFIAASIARAAARWDTLLAVIQSSSSAIENRAMAAERLLRLAVVDLSLRAFALARLAELEPPPETPLWAQQNGGGRLLRQFTEQAGLTRDQLAARLEVSYTAVDNWLDGKNRPTPRYVAALAKELAGNAKATEARQMEQTIQRQLTFAHLADLLEPWLGREQITELSAALVRFIRLITEDVRAMDRPPLETAAGMEVDAFRLGTDHIPSHTLLKNLALVERDADWQRDILTAAGDWQLPFQEIASQAGLPRSAAGLAQDVLDLAFADPAAEALQQLAAELPNSQYWLNDAPGDLSKVFEPLERGIALRRAIVREFPLSPRAHYELGSFAGMVGKHLRVWGQGRGFIKEGIIECKIAASLLPEWDAPAVEPGIILINIGEYAAALEELNRAQEVLPQATPHLLINSGYALMQLSQYAAALANFERVIDARPDYAMAYKFAAHCAFALNDRRKGLRYAKTARQLGEPAVFNDWRRGKYRPSHPGAGKL